MACPSRFFPLEAGMGLGQSYLAISRTFSILVSESCMQLQPTEGPAKRQSLWNSSVSLAWVWREALMLVSGTLAPCLVEAGGEWQGKSYFRGWTPVGTKPTIELSRSHLQSWGRDIFHPGRSSAVPSWEILQSTHEKYSKAHRKNTSKEILQCTQGRMGQRSQHHARWKLHKAHQPVGRVASFQNLHTLPNKWFRDKMNFVWSIRSSLLIGVDQRIYIHHLETLQTLAQADYTFCLLISNFAREVTSEAVFGPNLNLICVIWELSILRCH